MSRRLLLVLGPLALLAAACSGGGGTSAAPSEAPAASVAAPSAAAVGCSPSTDAGTVTVTIAGRSYSPGTVTAAVGDVITWTNNDSVPHTATLDEGDCSTGSLGGGDSGGLTFSEAGTYPYHCRIHPDMTGTIEISG